MVRLAAFLVIIFGHSALADCRQALAIGLDVSGSVDSAEYRLQLDGLSSALLHPDVQKALLSMPSLPVQIAVFEWGGRETRALIADWTVVSGGEALNRLAAQIHNHRRKSGDPKTALGAAILFGRTLLQERPECRKHTLDISGDGENNDGPRPRDLQRELARTDITLNALVIAERDTADDLAAYFRAEVIRGPGAFVEQAAGYADYKQAMVRKLLRELQGLAVSQLVPDQ